MAISGTTQLVKTALQEKTRWGLYSLPMWEGMSPFMKNILFGNETFGQAKSTKVTVKDILLSPTTSKDGKSVEWRTLAVRKPKTTVNGAVSNSSSVVVADGKGFSVGDYVVFRDASGDITAYIDAISGNNITLSAPITVADGTPVVRVAYSKGKSAVIDRLDYDLQYETFSNYFQDFGAKKTFDTDLLNSNLDIDLNISDWTKSPRELLKSKEVLSGIQNYLQLEFARKVGSEILGDVEMTFISGKKAEKTLGGSVRRYSMGLEEVSETVNISASASDKDKFNAISDTIYDVINRSYAFQNTNVSVICNNEFYKSFMKLMQDKVQYTTDVTESGTVLNKITFVGGRTIELQLVPSLDNRYGNTPTAFVIPMDLIGAYIKKYNDIDASSNGFSLKSNTPDIMIKKNVSDQDTLDTFSFSIYYVLGFIFGGAEEGIYKKIIIS